MASGGGYANTGVQFLIYKAVKFLGNNIKQWYDMMK